LLRIGAEALFDVDRKKVEHLIPADLTCAIMRPHPRQCLPTLISPACGGRNLIIFFNRLICFLDQKDDPLGVAFSDFNPIAGLPDQIGDIDDRERISAVDFKAITSFQRLQRLARLERRQRAFEPGQIELGRGHARNMEKPGGKVNGFTYRLAMTFAHTRSAFVARESRSALFRIMRYSRLA
jgi:hypothetical protein